MVIEIKVLIFLELVVDGIVVIWYKKLGEVVKCDELIVDIEIDKVVIEVFVEVDGVLVEIIKNEGDIVLSNELFGKLNEGGVVVLVVLVVVVFVVVLVVQVVVLVVVGGDDVILFLVVCKLVEEVGIDLNSIVGIGKGGCVIKEDVVVVVEVKKNVLVVLVKFVVLVVEVLIFVVGDCVEKCVLMICLWVKVVECLVEVQFVMVMLIIFNEVNMKLIMDLCLKYKDLFEKKYNGVCLGFMFFFVKVVIEVLKCFLGVNVFIDGNDIVYYGYQDIGVVVFSDCGLVVLVLCNVEFMSLVEIEGGIVNFGKKVKEGKLIIEDMIGGIFIIFNGGVFGFLLLILIVNLLQIVIFGMYKIQECLMVVNGQVVILLMMYLVLFYDYCLIDGKEVVSFLVVIKDLLEDLVCLLLDV